jgi:hypothetical protein
LTVEDRAVIEAEQRAIWKRANELLAQELHESGYWLKLVSDYAGGTATAEELLAQREAEREKDPWRIWIPD